MTSYRKTYFVTGGAGFIGSALVRKLANKPDIKVVNIDKLTYAGNLSNVASVVDKPNYRFVNLDICNQEAISDLFIDEQPDGLFHLAAESHVDKSIDGAGEFLQTNLIGTFSLLEATRHYLATLSKQRASNFRFLHVSTDEVYGSLGDTGLFQETTSYDPRSPYSATKAGSDFLASAWYYTYDMPVIISNCSNNYGPFHLPEKFIPLTILRAVAELELPIYGDGLNVRDWLYVDDHAAALQLILENGETGQKYNVGGRNERTNLEVVSSICDYLDQVRPRTKGGHSELVTFVEDRPGHDRRYAIDATKLEMEFAWKAQENFESGIRKTVDWFLANEAWWLPLVNFAFKRQGG